MPDVKLTFIPRTVDAPDKEYLTKAEAAKWIGIGTRLFDILVSEGKILPPKVMGPKTHRWHWTTILAYINQRV